MSKVTFVGIDVSARELVVAGSKDSKPVCFANDARGHKALIKHLQGKGRTARVCMEATGVYGLDVALALNRAKGIEVMVANPRAVNDFAGALMSRGKTDPVDTGVLAQFAERMPFVPYKPPAAACLELRTISRRIDTYTRQLRAEKNRLHADGAAAATGRGITGDIKAHIRYIDGRIDYLRVKAERLIAKHEELSEWFVYLTSVKGIARASAIQILGEISVLPQGMNKRQWTAHAGLDPRQFDSGSSVHRPARISKAGNRYLRSALFMPALVAIRYEPGVKAFYDRLIGAGKRPLQAILAVMRKLLCAIWGMFRYREPFDGSKFYNASSQT